jgi:hypothetical protein
MNLPKEQKYLKSLIPQNSYDIHSDKNVVGGHHWGHLYSNELAHIESKRALSDSVASQKRPRFVLDRSYYDFPAVDSYSDSFGAV